jgi:hypothetical protein
VHASTMLVHGKLGVTPGSNATRLLPRDKSAVDRDAGAKSAPELRNHVPEFRRKPGENFGADRLRHTTMERLCDPTRDRRLRVRVAAERDCESNGRLDAVALEERRDRLGDRALAGDIELVARADVA